MSAERVRLGTGWHSPAVVGGGRINLGGDASNLGGDASTAPARSEATRLAEAGVTDGSTLDLMIEPVDEGPRAGAQTPNQSQSRSRQTPPWLIARRKVRCHKGYYYAIYAMRVLCLRRDEGERLTSPRLSGRDASATRLQALRGQRNDVSFVLQTERLVLLHWLEPPD